MHLEMASPKQKLRMLLPVVMSILIYWIRFLTRGWRALSTLYIMGKVGVVDLIESLRALDLLLNKMRDGFWICR